MSEKTINNTNDLLDTPPKEKRFRITPIDNDEIMKIKKLPPSLIERLNASFPNEEDTSNEQKNIKKGGSIKNKKRVSHKNKKRITRKLRKLRKK